MFLVIVLVAVTGYVCFLLLSSAFNNVAETISKSEEEVTVQVGTSELEKYIIQSNQGGYYECGDMYIKLYPEEEEFAIQSKSWDHAFTANGNYNPEGYKLAYGPTGEIVASDGSLDFKVNDDGSGMEEIMQMMGSKLSYKGELKPSRGDILIGTLTNSKLVLKDKSGAEYLFIKITTYPDWWPKK